MKLLFVFTGGTIGSKVSDNYIKTDDKTPYELIDAYDKEFGLTYSYDIIAPYTKLSENNTGRTISELTRCVVNAISKIDSTDKKSSFTYKNDSSVEKSDFACNYDGVIVTHGTDTLPYSAAALDYAIGRDGIPVCIVSANYPINDKRSNALANLHGAIRLIKASKDCLKNQEENSDMPQKSLHGVFVPYTNHDGITYIHRPTKLLETLACSDEYYSINNEYFGYIKNDRLCINNAYNDNIITQTSIINLDDECESIARIKFYPGLKLPAISQETKCVLIEAYHSGTINTEYSGYLTFFEEMKARNIPVFLVGVNKGIPYESTSVYEELGIVPIYDVAPVAVYMKLWMLAAEEDITKVQGFFGG